MQEVYTFNAERSKEIWNSIYQLAKEDKLTCLKQGSLFDEQTPQIETAKPKLNVTKLRDVEYWRLEGVAMGFYEWRHGKEKEDIKKEITKFITFNEEKHGNNSEKNWISMFTIWLLNNKELTPRFSTEQEEREIMKKMEEEE